MAKKEIESIKIKPKLSTLMMWKMLQDMIYCIRVNEALRKIDEMTEREMSKITEAE